MMPVMRRQPTETSRLAAEAPPASFAETMAARGKNGESHPHAGQKRDRKQLVTGGILPRDPPRKLPIAAERKSGLREFLSFCGLAGIISRGTEEGRYEGKQQDALIAGHSNLKTVKEVRRAMDGAFDAARAFFATVGWKGGSTCSLAAFVDGRLVTSQVGDSPILLYVYDEKTGKVELTNLTADHSADAPEEQERIAMEGGEVVKGRLMNARGTGTLALSRSFGDNGFPGLSSEAATEIRDLRTILKDPHKKAFVVVGSDGLTDHTDPEEFKALIAKGGSPASIAKRLMNCAWQAASEVEPGYKSDNISAVVMNLDPRSHGTSYIGVADGHGDQGEDFALHLQQFAQEAFHKKPPAAAPAPRHGGPRHGGKAAVG